jgi:MFS family permease
MGGVAFRQRLPLPLQQRDFTLIWGANLANGFGSQMVAVAVGWQVYAIHRSALDLGLIGLAEFVPLLVLALPAGHLSDRFPRRLVFVVAMSVEMVVISGLLVVSLAGAHQLWPFFALAAGTGAAGALGMPAGRALPAMVVPFDLIPNAMAVRSLSFQMATIAGPALGGFLFSIRPEAVYGAGVGILGLGLVALLRVRVPAVDRNDEPVSLHSVLAGIRFIRATPVIFGAITLDLFAVLFGGAMALLPLYARSILHTGPFGLGVLRSAIAVGALSAGIMLTRRPLGGRVGRTLMIAVALFGVGTIVFGFSHSFVLSVAALAVSGFVDMISMNIRSTTVALATPNELRGRVNAVEMVFISASNELGAFESGVAAALLGAVTAVVAGGAVTIGLSAVWSFIFPALAKIDRFEDVHTGSLESSADRPHSPGSPA